jgi:hypothetical protein
MNLMMAGDDVRCALCGGLCTDERLPEDAPWQHAFQSACSTCLELLFGTDLESWTG